MALETVHLEQLRQSFGGLVLEPGAEGYDETRAVHNGYIDRRPALITCCHGTSDIVAAVQLARASGLEVAVRGGGHNVAGRAVCDDGLMIDLSPMKGIFVDPVRRTARAQGGVTWAEFNRETQLHGLATTGGVISSTGIAGLTLGGGLGWLMGQHGMTVDNLISAEVVTATGEVVHASESEHPDLFWALRGGGGNFGIVSSFEFQLHPVGPEVLGGLVAHPFTDARDVLRFFREVTADLPDAMTLFGGLVHAPDGSGESLAAIVGCHAGTAADANAAVRPIKEFGKPTMDAFGPTSYSAMNAVLDGAFPRGALNYWKSSFISELSDEAIDTMIECFEACPSPMSSMMLEHFHGEATRKPVSATAYPHRSDGYNLLIAGEWLNPADSERNIAWARDTFEAMRPHMADGRYVNYLGEDEGEDPVAAAYGENYARLQQVKAQYDPENMFHLNLNIQPAS